MANGGEAVITERQRLEAVEACDRIVALNDELQQRCRNILAILNRAAAQNPQEESNAGTSQR
jgi:hypothetical protein